MDWEEVNFDTLPQDPDFKGPVLRKSSANGDSDPDWEARLVIVTIAALTLLILVKRAVLPPQRQSLEFFKVPGCLEQWLPGVLGKPEC